VGGSVAGPGRQGPLWTAAWWGAGRTPALLAREMSSETAMHGCGLPRPWLYLYIGGCRERELLPSARCFPGWETGRRRDLLPQGLLLHLRGSRASLCLRCSGLPLSPSGPRGRWLGRAPCPFCLLLPALAAEDGAGVPAPRDDGDGSTSLLEGSPCSKQGN